MLLHVQSMLLAEHLVAEGAVAADRGHAEGHHAQLTFLGSGAGRGAGHQVDGEVE